MKLVIDISKDIYEHAKEKSEDSNDEWDAMRAIANGTPLKEWLSSFNTDSAPICFNKIQELKRECEKDERTTKS